MKITIKDNAYDLYIGTVHNGQIINWQWANQLRALHGMTLEVETEHLFSDQFNTGPIEGISEQGMRVMAGSVEEVIDDARPGLMKCTWDFHVAPVGAYCPKCGSSEYLLKFDMSHHNVVAHMVKV